MRWSGRFWFQFHLTSLEVPDPLIIISCIVSIQNITNATAVIPPPSFVGLSTVATGLVIIPISGRERHSVIILRKVIPCWARIETNKQRVVSCLVSNRKIIILGVSTSTGCRVDFHSQLTRNLSQLMNLFVSKPKLSSDVTKPVLILVPVPVESNKPIEAFVKDCPSTAIRLHVTEHFKTGFVCWVHCVHSTLLEASSKQLGAVSGWKNKMN